MQKMRALKPIEEILRDGAPNFPPQTIVSVANPCNAHCPSCPMTNEASIRENYDNLFIRGDHFQKVADEIGKFQSVLRITGSGEPFLHKFLIGLIEYACKQGCRVGIINNGSELNEAKIERLMRARIEVIEFSVDAHTEEIYNVVRKGLKLSVVQDNIRTAINLRDKIQKDLPAEKRSKILVSVIDQPHLNPDVEGTIKFWEEFGTDKVLNRKYQTWGVQPKLHLSVPEPETQENRNPCPYPFDRMNIDTDGYFRLCPCDIVNIQPQTMRERLGHIEQNTIQETWLDVMFQQIRTWHLKREFYHLDICHTCDDYPVKLTSWDGNFWKSLEDARKKIEERMQLEEKAL